MKKRFIYKILGLALLVAGVMSCDLLRTAEQEASPVVSAEGKVIITGFSTNVIEGIVKEGDTIVFEVQIDQTIERSISFIPKIVGGDADENDLVIPPAVIKPYNTSAQVSIIVPMDWDAEGDETVKIEFSVDGIAERYFFKEGTEWPVIEFTIKNYVAEDYTITLTWDKEVAVMEEKEVTAISVDGKKYIVLDTLETILHAADEVDYDFMICPVEGFDINDPWANAVDDAATGDSPEVFKISGLDDGEYYIAYDLWTNAIADNYISIVDSAAFLNVTANMVRQGTSVDTEVIQKDSLSPFVFTPGFDDNEIGKTGVVAKLVVSGGKFTMMDFDAAAGKSAKIATPFSRARTISRRQ